MKRRNIIFLVFMLVVGFAAVSAVLVINGSVNLSFNNIEFTSNIIFTKATTNDGIVAINNNEQNINFETKVLQTVGDKAELDYEVTNKSRQYNASVTINIGLKDEFLLYNDYFEIINDITNPFELAPAESKVGKLTIKLKKAYTASDTTIEFLCTLVASPISRESVGDIYKRRFHSNYVDSNLNGTDPVLDDDKLVPVKLADNGEVTIVGPDESWYNYANKEWANAVILVDSPSKEYNVHDTIEESDIESYFVWIPRYRYQIFNTGKYNGIQSQLSSSLAKEIQIVFESIDTEVSTGSEVGSWLTHPAFTNYNTNGIWVGKFETGYAGATNKSEAQSNMVDISKIIIKPNVYSWRGISVSNIFKMSLAYESSLTSHMMRNTEWGAVVYLSHSKYGINDEVRINNNSNYLTGYAANQKDASSSNTNNSEYNTEIGYLASTTGNISGIYDMSGGAAEYIAAYRANTPGSSGFTTAELISEAYTNHLDKYNSNSSVTSYNNRILGDATGEMGPFYAKTGYYRSNWHADDYAFFIEASKPWFYRGGVHTNGSATGQFEFGSYSGGVYDFISFRFVLAF